MYHSISKCCIFISPGERFFPPPSGLSYSTWFCVERFSTPPQSHPVRLLTVVRRATSSEQHYVCLAIVLSAKDRSLIVSTKEELLQAYGKCFLQLPLLAISSKVLMMWNVCESHDRLNLCHAD